VAENNIKNKFWLIATFIMWPIFSDDFEKYHIFAFIQINPIFLYQKNGQF
jgi:hypothetical protein